MGTVAAYAQLNNELAQKRIGNQTDIVRKVWNTQYSNMSADEASASCEAIYEAKGSDAYNLCYSAGLTIGDSAEEKAIYGKYKAALLEGYTKPFSSFKKQSSALGFLSQGLGLLSSLFNKKEPAPIVVAPEPDKTNKTGMWIGISLGVIALGTGAYFLFRNKD